MINYIKKNYHYFLLFIFIFLTYSFFKYLNNYEDPINNYGFSYAITKGLLPYVDFNIISTPLYSFIMSMGLLIWNNYSMFLLEQSLLVTIMFYLLNKIYGKKSYIVLFSIACFSFLGINPTYNYLVLFMMIVLLFLEEKYNDKDYLIGIFIGLAILSKHTVGVLFILPSLIYYFKDKKKLLRRLLGLLIPCTTFLIYLFITKSFMKFIDLCVLGLFDFSKNNSNPYTLWFYLSIILFISCLIITIKNKKDIKNIYLLCGISFVIPLFDFFHFSIYIICISIQMLPFIKKYDNYFGNLSFILSIFITLTFFVRTNDEWHPVLNKKIKHFEYIYNFENCYLGALKNYDYLDNNYDNSLVLSYGYVNMMYDISRDKDIDYFDALFYGNYGYDGSRKMINRIKKRKDIYIIVDKRSYLTYSKNSQFDKIIVNYVMDNYVIVDETDDFLIYYKE